MSRFNNGSRDYSMDRLSLHPFYPIWNAMIQRCNNTKNVQHKNYGGIGIDVHDKWQPPKELGFVTFLRDMVDPHLLPGEDYFDPYFFRGKTLDRRFGPAGYNPENCRWVDYKVQNLNRRGAVVGRAYPQGVKLRAKDQRFVSYCNVDGKHRQLYSGYDLFEAVCVRKAWELQRYAELGESV